MRSTQLSPRRLQCGGRCLRCGSLSLNGVAFETPPLYGKTAWIRQVVTALVLLRPPERTRLLLVDFKRTEFGVFSGL